MREAKTGCNQKITADLIIPGYVLGYKRCDGTERNRVVLKE